jgi:hypothetical protein
MRALPFAEDQLLFILLALKTDAIQQHLAATFDIKQSAVSQWWRYLLPVLDETLRKLGHQPARTLPELVRRLRCNSPADDETDSCIGSGLTSGCTNGSTLTVGLSDEAREVQQTQHSLHLDVTVRQIPRSIDYEAQRVDYDGKAHGHVAKNTVVCDGGQEVHYLGPTWRGAMHDKKMADEELPDLSVLAQPQTACGPQQKPHRFWLTLDSGYQGYQPAGVDLLKPYKARRSHPLEEDEKEFNQWVASIRIVVEHAICGIKRLSDLPKPPR